jgi:hypothetical protein
MGEDKMIEGLMERLRTNPVMSKAIAETMEQEEMDSIDEIAGEFNPIRQHMKPPDECPSTPTPSKPPPGSLLSDIARPPSPSNVCDFQYYKLEQPHLSYHLQPSSQSMLPRFQTTKAELNQLRDEVLLTEDDSIEDWDDEECRISEVTSYTVGI